MKLRKNSLLYNYNEKIKKKLQLKYKQFNIKKIEFINNIIIIELSIKGYDIKEINIFYNSIDDYKVDIIDCQGDVYSIIEYPYYAIDLILFCNDIAKYSVIYQYIKNRYK